MKLNVSWDVFERIQKTIVGNRLSDCEPSGGREFPLTSEMSTPQKGW
jgi:hypothetical protein